MRTLTGILFVLGFAAARAAPAAAQQFTPDSLVHQAITLVEQNRAVRLPPPEWARAVQRASAAKPTTLDAARKVIREMLTPASMSSARFLTYDEFTPFFAEVSGEPHIGVGLLELLSIDVDPAGSGGFVVITPVPGSPAAKALQPGDRIERIGKADTKTLTLSQGVAMLRGDSGTTVNLAVRRGSAVVQVPLKRERIRLPAPVFGMRVPFSSDSALYVRIHQFTTGAGAAFGAVLDSAITPSVRAIVLDLRNNPGGLLTEAQQVVGALLGPIRIGNIAGRSGSTPLNAQGRQRSSLPIAVLINRGTASAAELVAAALTESRALGVGERSVGKGLIHTPFPLEDASLLLIGTGRLVTLTGHEITRNGVVPNFIRTGASPWERGGAEPGAASDTQLQAALTALTRPPATPR